MVLVNIYYKILRIMKNLKTVPHYCTYYANGGVIYKIEESTKPNTDTHAIVFEKRENYDNNHPDLRSYFSTKKDGELTPTLHYLDGLVEDGDKISKEADSEIFKKVCHECSPEGEKDLFSYYVYLCERQIASAITNNYKTLKYKDIYDPSNNVNKLSMLGVPEYMYQQNYDKYTYTIRTKFGTLPETIAKSKLINFTEAKYNSLLSDEILRRTKEAANNVANKYDKKVDTLTLTNA